MLRLFKIAITVLARLPLLYFEKKFVKRRFLRYIGLISSGKNNTQCTQYLKAKNKLMIPMVKGSLRNN